jgi:hypothetical protein
MNKVTNGREGTESRYDDSGHLRTPCQYDVKSVKKCILRFSRGKHVGEAETMRNLEFRNKISTQTDNHAQTSNFNVKNKSQVRFGNAEKRIVSYHQPLKRLLL